jgi:hypothetical protein
LHCIDYAKKYVSNGYDVNLDKIDNVDKSNYTDFIEFFDSTGIRTGKIGKSRIIVKTGTRRLPIKTSGIMQGE